MALIKCPDCRADVSSNAASCPKCGAIIAGKGAVKTKPDFWRDPNMGALGLLAVIAVFCLCYFLFWL